MRRLSVVIPAYNEEENIEKTILTFSNKLIEEKIPHEILIINDNSKDGTLGVLEKISNELSTVRFITNSAPNGYGYAVRKGLENFSGECVAVTMADLSDDPNDLVNYYRTMEDNNCDMVFGSRWMKGAKVVDYPKHKLLLNRIVNHIIRIMFCFKYNDVTNGFKLFSRETIDGIRPFLSGQFSLALEIPLKAIIRDYSYKVVPNSWYNREVGKSNLRIKEMVSRYLFILFYCLNERMFSMGDYKKGKYNKPRK